MATTIKSTQLDFDTIKGRLKDFLKQQSEFEDYDFEASGLSNILDVLAYNTHFRTKLFYHCIDDVGTKASKRHSFEHK